MIRIKVLYWLTKALICGLLQIGDKKWQIAGRELISKPTFRLPDYALNDKLIGIRMLKRIWFSFSYQKEVCQSYDVLIFDASTTDLTLRKDYIIWNKNFKDTQIYVCTRDVLFNYVKIKYIKPLLLILSVFVIPITIFSRNRIQWSLIFSEYVETMGLVNIVRKTHAKKLFFFSPAEKDSNFIYLVLKNLFKIEIFKHPSPGALVAHNKNLMTDVLVLSSKYQEEEYKLLLKNHIICKRTEAWPSESSKEYYHLYKENSTPEIFKHSIGFYSHGGWLRKKKSLSKALFARPEDEENCLKIVSKFVIENNLKIKIYLHPKEKENLEETKIYYYNFLDMKNIDFYLENLPSSFDFMSVKIGVCAYSAILFERDNFGFETLVWREKNNKFPIHGTKLYDNSFNNYNEFLTLFNKKINSI